MTASKTCDSWMPLVSVTTSHWPEVAKSGCLLTLRAVVLHQSPTKQQSGRALHFGEDLPANCRGCQGWAGSPGSYRSPLELLNPTLHLSPGEGVE